jgi:hypothetical protein
MHRPEAVDMNGRFQMQGGKNWFLPKEMNANRFFWDSHWLEIWSNHFYPSMGPNGGSVAMDSGLAVFCKISWAPPPFSYIHLVQFKSCEVYCKMPAGYHSLHFSVVATSPLYILIGNQI